MALHPVQASYQYTPAVANVWTGSVSNNWYDWANWSGQDMGLPAYFLPTAIGGSGQPAVVRTPVLGSTFSTPVLSFSGSSSQALSLRLVSGGVLTSGWATVGAAGTSPTPAAITTTLHLDGGITQGYWQFAPDARVQVSAAYGAQSLGSWTGRLGQLVIDAGSGLTWPQGGASFAQLISAGTLSLGGDMMDATGVWHQTGLVDVGQHVLNVRDTLILQGAGGVTLLQGGRIAGTSGSILTIETGQTLSGYGNLGDNAQLMVSNQGTVLVDPQRTLVFAGQVMQQTGDGVLRLGAGSTFVNDGGLIRGGTLDAAMFAPETIAGQGRFEHLHLTGHANIQGGTWTDVLFDGAHTLNGQLYASGAWTLQGTVVMQDATLTATGDLLVQGDRTLTVKGNASIASVPGVQVTLAAGASMFIARSLNLGGEGSTVRNRGLIDLAFGSTLNIAADQFDNVGGTLMADSNANAHAQRGVVHGGKLVSEGRYAQISSDTGIWRDITLTGPWQVARAQAIGSGRWQVNDELLVTGGHLLADGELTLSGAGITRLINRQIDHVPGKAGTLIIDIGHTLEGQGMLGGGNSPELFTLRNRGTLRVVDGRGQESHLQFGGTLLDNASGRIELTSNTWFWMTSGEIVGGTIASSGAGTGLGDARIRSATLTGPMTLRRSQLTNVTLTDTVRAERDLRIQGTINIQGDLFTDPGAGIVLAGPTTLTGSGRTWLQGGYIDSEAGSTLTIGAGHLLRGYGTLGGGPLGTGRMSVVNLGTIELDGPGNLSFLGDVLDNRNGLVQLALDRQLEMATGRLLGGILSGGANDARRVARVKGELDSVTLRNTLAVGQALQLRGSTRQEGELQVPLGSVLHLANGSTVSGVGQTKLDRSFVRLESGSTVTWGRGQVLSGWGTVAASGPATLVLTGELRPDSPMAAMYDPYQLRFSQIQLLQRGRVHINRDQGLILENGSTWLQDDSSAITEVNGELTVPTLHMLSGVLQGSGIIHGHSFIQGGRLLPGGDGALGHLTLSGRLNLGSNAQLEIDVNGLASSSDLLEVQGDVRLDGLLTLHADASALRAGMSFNVLRWQGQLTGQFQQVLLSGWQVRTSVRGQGLWVDILAAAPVPEPSTWALTLAGALVLWRTRRKPQNLSPHHI